MGSSAKKKQEKKKDFKKPKYKVGKAAPKASNFTDTSFKAKTIAMGQQSLSTSAPDDIHQFKHNFSLVSSKSDKQRREALAYLTTQLSGSLPENPVGSGALLAKVLPMLSDSSTPVRTQLAKLLRTIPSKDVRLNTEKASMFVRAGLTHLSTDIRTDSLGVLDWLVDEAGFELVTCPGGWVKTLKSLCAMMGWSLATKRDGWSATARGGIRGKDSQQYARQIAILTKFLNAGLQSESGTSIATSVGPESIYRVSRDSRPFDYLNLFGQSQDEDGRGYADRDDRRQVFHRKFMNSVLKGTEHARQEGGPSGRAANSLSQALKAGMEDYDPATAVEDEDLLGLW